MDFGLLISKTLGYGIIAGSLILQAPQILKIINAKSVAGLAAISYWLQLVGYAITFAYSFNAGFAFSTYGESAFILVQNLIIVYLIHKYRRQLTPLFYAEIVVFLGFTYALVSGTVPLGTLSYLQGFTIPIFCFSKIPQIWSNFTNKGVGQLSFVTAFLTFAGSAARVFTTFKEVPDNIILAGYVIGSVLNLIIVLQFLLYWNNTTGGVSKPKTKKKN